jgi:hypothetical protein
VKDDARNWATGRSHALEKVTGAAMMEAIVERKEAQGLWSATDVVRYVGKRDDRRHAQPKGGESERNAEGNGGRRVERGS